MDEPHAEVMQELYDEHAAPLWRYAMQLTGDHARAEDVVQETSLRAWQHPEVTDDSQRSARSWLFRIARNVIIDERRSSRFRHEVSPLDDTGVPERASPDEVDAALDQMLIGDALAQLSAGHRAVIRRSYDLRWTAAQIADDLQIPEGTVKSRLHYTLRALRLTLHEEGHTMTPSRSPRALSLVRVGDDYALWDAAWRRRRSRLLTWTWPPPRARSWWSVCSSACGPTRRCRPDATGSGAVHGAADDPRDGERVDLQSEPQQPRVGTRIGMTCTYDVRPDSAGREDDDNAGGDKLAMVVIGRDGSRNQLATWVALTGVTATPTGSTSMQIDQIAAIQIVSADDRGVLMQVQPVTKLFTSRVTSRRQ